MQYEPWKTEFAKFTDASIEEMKRHSDDTHLEREWMTYIYEEDYGIMISNGNMPVLYRDESGEQKIFDTRAAAEKFQKENNISGQITTVYHLGEVSYGEESRIEVNPSTKEMQDAALKQVNPKNRKWTIHGHPLKDGKIYTGRQYFSSTDILQEFLNARDTNNQVVQFIVYPHQQKDTNTGKKAIHNRVRILIFPDSATVKQAMQEANPNVNVDGISLENGFNKNAADGSLQNAAGVDWFAFQEALGKRGYMGIVDIEGKKSGARKAEGISKLFGAESGQSDRLIKSATGAVLVGGLLYYLFGHKDSPFADVEVIDDKNAEAGKHWWHQ